MAVRHAGPARSPRGARPRSRAILVDSPVSSMNTSLAGSRSGCLSNQARRRLKMSDGPAPVRVRTFLNVQPCPRSQSLRALRLIRIDRSASNRSTISLSVMSWPASISSMI